MTNVADLRRAALAGHGLHAQIVRAACSRVWTRGECQPSGFGFDIDADRRNRIGIDPRGKRTDIRPVADRCMAEVCLRMAR
jgi:hypothetical protein